MSPSKQLTPLQRAINAIPFHTTEWERVELAIDRAILEIDVANRDITLTERQTLENRALQAALGLVKGWRRQATVSEQAAEVPVYAVNAITGSDYDPGAPHPDDEPV